MGLQSRLLRVVEVSCGTFWPSQVRVAGCSIICSHCLVLLCMYKSEDLPNVGALIIRRGFWGPLYDNYNKEPPKPYSNYFRPLH